MSSCYRVSPYGGVWIEIHQLPKVHIQSLVTPYGGVWIEIPAAGAGKTVFEVTPYGGVWIEMIGCSKRSI